MNSRGRRLLWHGMLLFGLGLVTGLVSQQFTNPRMGLSAHLEGVMNGTFLLALGLAWSHVRLSERGASVAFAATLFGAYANWLTTTAAAVFGTAAMTPLASGAHKGEAWQEAVIAIGFGSVAISMVVASVLLLIGFRGAPPSARPPESP